jgi:hypothetical protein
MNIKLRPFALCLLTVLISSCATSSIKQTWKAPDYQGPVGKIAVLTIAERAMLRQGFENRFVQSLATNEAPAVPTFDLLSLPEIKQNKEAAAARFRSTGAEALLIVRLVDTVGSYHEIQPGHQRYAAVPTGDSMGWYGYYEIGFMKMNATYGSVKDKVYLDSSLFDLKTGTRVWSALSQTVLVEDMDRVAEMDPLVAKIVAAMKKDGVIR